MRVPCVRHGLHYRQRLSRLCVHDKAHEDRDQALLGLKLVSMSCASIEAKPVAVMRGKELSKQVPEDKPLRGSAPAARRARGVCLRRAGCCRQVRLLRLLSAVQAEEVVEAGSGRGQALLLLRRVGDGVDDGARCSCAEDPTCAAFISSERCSQRLLAGLRSAHRPHRRGCDCSGRPRLACKEIR